VRSGDALMQEAIHAELEADRQDPPARLTVVKR
jgi:hypothetical protein